MFIVTQRLQAFFEKRSKKPITGACGLVGSHRESAPMMEPCIVRTTPATHRKCCFGRRQDPQNLKESSQFVKDLTWLQFGHAQFVIN